MKSKTHVSPNNSDRCIAKLINDIGVHANTFQTPFSKNNKNKATTTSETNMVKFRYLMK